MNLKLIMKPYTGLGTVSYPRNKNYSSFDDLVAEREGFEPSKRLLVYTLSKRACSTTPPSLRNKINNLRGLF